MAAMCTLRIIRKRGYIFLILKKKNITPGMLTILSGFRSLVYEIKQYHHSPSYSAVCLEDFLIMTNI